MCGIVGFFDYKNKISNKNTVLLSMMSSIAHRGPDSNGKWNNLENTLYLGHLRLSIIDTSPGGHQPMHSNSDRFVISYNGEIYNFISIRNELKKLNIKFNSSSDTEVLLCAIEYWGIDEALNKFEGMFAIALYDKKEKNLYLIRDRIGEKPLFYGFENGIFFFSSEIRSINKIPGFKKLVCQNSINTFLHHGYFLEDQTIYKNVKNLRAGSYLKLKISEEFCSFEETIEIIKYWSLKPQNIKENFLNIDDSVDQLDNLLKKVVSDQMITDVPLGAFLSGGVDSSLIVAIMSELSTRKVKTFSIGFENQFYDESKYASEISNYLGTDHHEMIISDFEIIELATSMANIYDQPFGDVSSIPTRLVSNFAKSEVTVSLSGDAGDELFCGYDRYSFYDTYYNMPFKNIIGPLINNLPKKLIENIFANSPIQSFKYINSRRIAKFASMLNSNKNSRFAYQSLLMHTTDMYNLGIISDQSSLANNKIYYQELKNTIDITKDINHLEYAMRHDINSYLPNDILVKVDRAAMGVSLETRIPFLNHKVVEFSQGLPIGFKYNKSMGKKAILKKLLSKKIPKKLFDRPKKGFGVPIENWLRGPLMDWMNESLSQEQLSKTNLFNRRGIDKILYEFKNSNNLQGQLIWNILMLQNWMNANNVTG